MDDDPLFDFSSDYSGGMSPNINKNNSGNSNIDQQSISKQHSLPANKHTNSNDISHIFQYYNSNVHVKQDANNNNNKQQQQQQNKRKNSNLHSGWMPSQPVLRSHKKSQSDTSVIVVCLPLSFRLPYCKYSLHFIACVLFAVCLLIG